MSATLTTVNSILKEMYEGSVNNQLNEERVLAKRLERTADGVSDNVGGQHVVFPVRNRRNSGISYRAESAALAAAGRQGYARATENLQYGYGRFEVTGPLMALAESNPQSFMSAMDGEMDGLKDDLAKDENRIHWGHPDSASKDTGILAEIVTVVSAPTYEVDNVHNFWVGMQVDCIDTSSETQNGSTAEVTDVDYDNNEITIDSSFSGAAIGDYITREGNYGLEPYGTMSLVGNTGTVHGINSDSAGNGYWKSVVDSTTTTLTEQSMIALCDTIRQNGGSKPSAIFCSLGVRRAYFNILTSLRRYNEPKNFPGGLTGLSFNHGTSEIPVVADPDAPKQTALFLSEKDVKIFRKKDWYFEDSAGGILQWKTGYDVFEGLAKCYWQMGVPKRNAHGVMNNITEPA